MTSRECFQCILKSKLKGESLAKWDITSQLQSKYDLGVVFVQKHAKDEPILREDIINHISFYRRIWTATEDTPKAKATALSNGSLINVKWPNGPKIVHCRANREKTKKNLKETSPSSLQGSKEKGREEQEET